VASSEESGLSVRLENHIAIVTLDRPPVNAISYTLREEIGETFTRLDSNRDVRVVILTGRRVFSAGVDIHELLADSAAGAVRRAIRFYAAFAAVERCRQPVVAAINGYALGGGCELALHCDIRVAASDAFFALPEVKLGGVPGIGGMQRIARVIGEGRAKQLVFTGSRLPASEAYRLNLVDMLSEPDGALDAAHEIAAAISASPQLAVQAAKKAINAGRAMPIDVAQQIDLTHIDEVAGTKDRQECLQAFLEHREPRLRGE
jgi:enoyl-CoA hydratase/carnithine racemase